VDRAASALLEGVAVSTGAPVLPPFWSPITQSDGSTLAPPPAIDLAQVTPTVDDVAILCRTRTIHDDLTEVSTFDTETRPTDVECQELISQALGEVLVALPPNVDMTLWASPIRRVIALRAAGLVETSFYREQATAPAGPAAAHAAAFANELRALQGLIPLATYIA
jgi:hypothetical protein